MIETMYAAPGIGLAAPQVGVSLRIFVIDLSLGPRSAPRCIVMINPEFVEREGMQLEEEGCLSVPGFIATVARPKRGGRQRPQSRRATSTRVEGTGLLARALQHEIDHLDWLPVRRSPARHLARSDRAQDQEARAKPASGNRLMPLRVAFFGTPGFAVPTLDALIGFASSGRGRGHAARPAARARPTGHGRARSRRWRHRAVFRCFSPSACRANCSRRSSRRCGPTSVSSPPTARSCRIGCWPRPPRA